jgi:predicted transposase/invertase (TIGR01784 family)
MNIKTDFAFKKIFGKKKLLISFLNALGTLSELIVDIEYLPLEQLGYIKTIRKAVYDVYVKTVSGKCYIIEMQISEQQHFAERMILYASHAVIAQAHKGSIITINDKGEEVKRAWNYEIAGVYVIAILDFVMFKEEVAENIIIEEVELMRQTAKIPFSDKLKFSIIELPKLQKTIDALSTLKEKWLFVLRYMHTFRSRPKQMNEDIFKELYYEARINKLTNEEMNEYKQSVLEYEDVISAVNWAEEKGIRKGREEGREEGIRKGREEGIRKGQEEERIRLVKHFRSRGMSLKQIAESLDLTEEQVYNMLDR